MNPIVTVLILFILIGETFFRDAFHQIWLWIGGAFALFLAIFHINENRQQKKRNKSSKGS